MADSTEENHSYLSGDMSRRSNTENSNGKSSFPHISTISPMRANMQYTNFSRGVESRRHSTDSIGATIQASDDSHISGASIPYGSLLIAQQFPRSPLRTVRTSARSSPLRVPPSPAHSIAMSLGDDTSLKSPSSSFDDENDPEYQVESDSDQQADDDSVRLDDITIDELNMLLIDKKRIDAGFLPTNVNTRSKRAGQTKSNRSIHSPNAFTRSSVISPTHSRTTGDGSDDDDDYQLEEDDSSSSSNTESETNSVGRYSLFSSPVRFSGNKRALSAVRTSSRSRSRSLMSLERPHRSTRPKTFHHFSDFEDSNFDVGKNGFGNEEEDEGGGDDDDDEEPERVDALLEDLADDVVVGGIVLPRIIEFPALSTTSVTNALTDTHIYTYSDGPARSTGQSSTSNTTMLKNTTQRSGRLSALNARRKMKVSSSQVEPPVSAGRVESEKESGEWTRRKLVPPSVDSHYNSNSALNNHFGIDNGVQLSGSSTYPVTGPSSGLVSQSDIVDLGVSVSVAYTPPVQRRKKSKKSPLLETNSGSSLLRMQLGLGELNSNSLNAGSSATLGDSDQSFLYGSFGAGGVPFYSVHSVIRQHLLSKLPSSSQGTPLVDIARVHISKVLSATRSGISSADYSSVFTQLALLPESPPTGGSPSLHDLGLGLNTHDAAQNPNFGLHYSPLASPTVLPAPILAGLPPSLRRLLLAWIVPSGSRTRVASAALSADLELLRAAPRDILLLRRVARARRCCLQPNVILMRDPHTAIHASHIMNPSGFSGNSLNNVGTAGLKVKSEFGSNSEQDELDEDIRHARRDILLPPHRVVALHGSITTRLRVENGTDFPFSLQPIASPNLRGAASGLHSSPLSLLHMGPLPLAGPKSHANEFSADDLALLMPESVVALLNLRQELSAHYSNQAEKKEEQKGRSVQFVEPNASRKLDNPQEATIPGLEDIPESVESLGSDYFSHDSAPSIPPNCAYLSRAQMDTVAHLLRQAQRLSERLAQRVALLGCSNGAAHVRTPLHPPFWAIAEKSARLSGAFYALGRQAAQRALDSTVSNGEAAVHFRMAQDHEIEHSDGVQETSERSRHVVPPFGGFRVDQSAGLNVNVVDFLQESEIVPSKKGVRLAVVQLEDVMCGAFLNQLEPRVHEEARQALQTLLEFPCLSESSISQRTFLPEIYGNVATLDGSAVHSVAISSAGGEMTSQDRETPSHYNELNPFASTWHLFCAPSSTHYSPPPSLLLPLRPQKATFLLRALWGSQGLLSTRQWKSVLGLGSLLGISGTEASVEVQTAADSLYHSLFTPSGSTDASVSAASDCSRDHRLPAPSELHMRAFRALLDVMAQIYGSIYPSNPNSNSSLLSTLNGNGNGNALSVEGETVATGTRVHLYMDPTSSFTSPNSQTSIYANSSSIRPESLLLAHGFLKHEKGFADIQRTLFPFKSIHQIKDKVRNARSAARVFVMSQPVINPAITHPVGISNVHSSNAGFHDISDLAGVEGGDDAPSSPPLVRNTPTITSASNVGTTNSSNMNSSSIVGKFVRTPPPVQVTPGSSIPPVIPNASSIAETRNAIRWLMNPNVGTASLSNVLISAASVAMSYGVVDLSPREIRLISLFDSIFHGSAAKFVKRVKVASAHNPAIFDVVETAIMKSALEGLSATLLPHRGPLLLEQFLKQKSFSDMEEFKTTAQSNQCDFLLPGDVETLLSHFFPETKLKTPVPVISVGGAMSDGRKRKNLNLNRRTLASYFRPNTPDYFAEWEQSLANSNGLFINRLNVKNLHIFPPLVASYLSLQAEAEGLSYQDVNMKDSVSKVMDTPEVAHSASSAAQDALLDYMNSFC